MSDKDNEKSENSNFTTQFFSRPPIDSEGLGKQLENVTPAMYDEVMLFFCQKTVTEFEILGYKIIGVLVKVDPEMKDVYCVPRGIVEALPGLKFFGPFGETPDIPGILRALANAFDRMKREREGEAVKRAAELGRKVRA